MTGKYENNGGNLRNTGKNASQDYLFVKLFGFNVAHTNSVSPGICACVQGCFEIKTTEKWCVGSSSVILKAVLFSYNISHVNRQNNVSKFFLNCIISLQCHVQ